MYFVTAVASIGAPLLLRRTGRAIARVPTRDEKPGPRCRGIISGIPLPDREHTCSDSPCSRRSRSPPPAGRRTRPRSRTSSSSSPTTSAGATCRATAARSPRRRTSTGMAKEGVRFTQVLRRRRRSARRRGAGIITGQFPARWRITSFLQTRAGNRGVRAGRLPRPEGPVAAADAEGGRVRHRPRRQVAPRRRPRRGRRRRSSPPTATTSASAPGRAPSRTRTSPRTDWIWSADDKVKRWDRTAVDGRPDARLPPGERRTSRASSTSGWTTRTRRGCRRPTTSRSARRAGRRRGRHAGAAARRCWPRWTGRSAGCSTGCGRRTGRRSSSSSATTARCRRSSSGATAGLRGQQAEPVRGRHPRAVHRLGAGQSCRPA